MVNILVRMTSSALMTTMAVSENEGILIAETAGNRREGICRRKHYTYAAGPGYWL